MTNVGWYERAGRARTALPERGYDSEIRSCSGVHFGSNRDRWF